MTVIKTAHAGQPLVWLGVVAIVSLCGLGCDDDNDEPTLKIENPKAGETVEIESNMKLTIDISVSNFNVQAPGACNPDDDDVCGQILLRIDGNACNVPGTNYNAILIDDAGEIDADFSLCSAGKQLGPHSITVTLMPDATSAPAAGPIEASVSIVAVAKM